MADLLLVWMSPSVSPSPSEPSPSCCAVVVLMPPVLELILPGPAGWPSTVVSPYALLRPETIHTYSQVKIYNCNKEVTIIIQFLIKMIDLFKMTPKNHNYAF